MNRALRGRIASVLFAFYALSFSAFFIYALVTFPASRFLRSMQWKYALDTGFSLFTDYLIPIHAAGIAIAVSLFGVTRNRKTPAAATGTAAGTATGAAPQPFGKLASSSLVMFIILAVAYTALFLGLYPRVRQSLTGMEYQSRLARELLAQAESSRKKGDYLSALDSVALYLAIDRDNPEVSDLKLELDGLAARQEAPGAALGAETRARPSADLDAQALIDKARFYFEREDWFSAHYYALQAGSLDPRRTDALRMAALAQERISGFAQSSKDAKTAELFQKKKKAYDLLEAGNAVAAYYEFMSLSAQYPKDQDIATYLAQSSMEVKKESFFLQEILKLRPLPGFQNILFLNSANDDAMTEAVFVEKMVETTPGEAYLFGIEAVNFDAAGSVRWHFRAPYGKLTGATVVMRCIDEKDSRRQYAPVYIKGTRSGEERNILRMQRSIDELRALNVGQDGLQAMGLPNLWRLRNELAASGLPRESLTMDMVMKTLMPFAFLVVSLLSVTLGWAFRARRAWRLSAFTVILIPLVPLLVSLLTLLFIHAQRIVLGFLVLALGGLTAILAAFAGLQIAFLAVALVLLAGQAVA